MTLVEPGKAPRLGKGGSLASRQAIIHSLAHIENWAVDLSWDIIARFGADDSYDLPESFFSTTGCGLPPTRGGISPSWLGGSRQSDRITEPLRSMMACGNRLPGRQEACRPGLRWSTASTR